MTQPVTDIAVRVRGLGKRYRLGEKQAYATLRDAMASLWRKEPQRERSAAFWALRDVDFELREGESLGIIGRNGAGKSTLLKVLSRITAPDEGVVELNGTVGSLLEVGTGFHPELTGRENVFLNGVLLGMSRRQVKRRFDEIVAFAGVEQFLDTPVKRYSSGMRVRLGFAVAAFLEPRVLLVDEVLAVGDAEFQRRCLGRMQQVAGEGRTILFVSHQMEAIQSLCSRAIWLNAGSVKMDGLPEGVVRAYLADTLGAANRTSLQDRTDRSGEGRCRFAHLTINPDHAGIVATGGPLVFRMALAAREGFDSGGAKPILRLALRDQTDRLIAFLSNELTNQELLLRQSTQFFSCTIDRLPLVPGSYILDVSLWMNDVLQDKIFRAISFDVTGGDFYGTGRSTHVGLFHLDQRWA